MRSRGGGTTPRRVAITRYKGTMSIRGCGCTREHDMIQSEPITNMLPSLKPNERRALRSREGRRPFVAGMMRMDWTRGSQQSSVETAGEKKKKVKYAAYVPAVHPAAGRASLLLLDDLRLVFETEREGQTHKQRGRRDDPHEVPRRLPRRFQERCRPHRARGEGVACGGWDDVFEGGEALQEGLVHDFFSRL